VEVRERGVLRRGGGGGGDGGAVWDTMVYQSSLEEESALWEGEWVMVLSSVPVVGMSPV
jgi:hypothetical protein